MKRRVSLPLLLSNRAPLAHDESPLCGLVRWTQVNKSAQSVLGRLALTALAIVASAALTSSGWAQDWERARQGAFGPEGAEVGLSGRSEGGRARTSRGASADGRITARSYLSADTSEDLETPTVSISFLETDLRARNLTDQGLSLDLDATFILDISQANERRFGETERFDQVRQLSITQPIGDVQLSLGRRLIFQAGNAWVDGLDVRIPFDQKRSAVGLYGGLSPDRFDRSLTLDYQAMGLYGELHREGLDLSGAYNLILFKGELDRHFAHQRAHWMITEGLFLSNYLILDLVDEPQITTLLSTIDYSPTRTLNFSLSFTQYALEQYRNQAVYRDVIEPNQALILGNEVVNLTYQRLRFSSSLRFAKSARAYLMVELKSRAQDGRRAQIYTAGVSEQDLFETGVEVDLRTQVAQQFRTDNVIVALTARRDLTKSLSLDGRVTYFTGESLDEDTDRLRLFSEAQQIYLFGITLSSRLSLAHHLLLTYDGVYEADISDYKSAESILINTLSFSYSYLY